MIAILIPTLLVLSAAVPGQPDDWPIWRGPAGTNISVEIDWSPIGQEEPLWHVNIGQGYSTPVIEGGRLYINGYFSDADSPGEGLDRVQCLDVATGAVQWSIEYPATSFANEHAGGAISSPVLADGVLYLLTRAGELRALRAADGEQLWLVDLVEREGVDPGRYGFASSPYVFEGVLVVNASRTIMLECESGETLWASEDYSARYSTVAPLIRGDVPCLVTFGEAGIVLLDTATGTELSSIVFRLTPRNVEGATPIVVGTRVFISSAYDQGGVLVDFAGEEPELLWRTRRMRNKMGACTLFEGYLYGFDESMLKCIDLEGNEKWRVRGLGHGALSIAGGRLLVTTSRGELVVADASPEGFEELSRRDVVSDGVFWATPLLSDARVFFRGSLGDLVCLDHSIEALDVALDGALDGAQRPGDGSGASFPGARLPSPASLEQKFLAAAGLDEKQPAALSFSGRLDNDALGLVDRPADWLIGAGGRWRSRFDLPPGMDGEIHVVFDGTRGWSTDPGGGAELLPEPEMAELKTTGGYHFLLDPLPEGLEASTVGFEEFHGVNCLRVDVQVTEDLRRQVYFNSATGLLAGRTSEKEDTLILAAWAKVETWQLPMHRTTFDSDTGEESRWRFTEVVLTPLDDTNFEFPDSLK
ncbi:MAG: outer membrane protein assembly factor BamB [Planctomycetota bacterium]|jgi:outer membrane protein assembly factor BamB